MSERRREVMWERKDEREGEQSGEGESDDLSLPSVSEITPTLRQPNRLMCQETPGKGSGERTEQDGAGRSNTTQQH